ncbi:calcium-binding protein [Microvirga puerhi]|uniref:Calcium-binding protein n=1 Tax=Microvirga puerhi TaxID=2876078 RepID=A0ABS7VMS5_9HYPH|nr:calcium-binding protein [Microvirga puerhi]MBZ6076435.1 hypothetical protein [Microvirga puerhi]
MTFSLEQELEAFFDNSGGGGIAYGGTGQTGTITGNPTGGSGSGTSYTQTGPDGGITWQRTTSEDGTYTVSYNVKDGADYYDMYVIYHPTEDLGMQIVKGWGQSALDGIQSAWQAYSGAVNRGADAFLGFQRDAWNSYLAGVRHLVDGDTSQQPKPPAEPVATIHKTEVVLVTGASTYTKVNMTFGSSGNDSLVGTGALFGDAGNDEIRGGAGSDFINGGADNDVLLGNAGSDVITGGDGNDIVYGGAGADRLDGGAGSDVLSYFDAQGGVTVKLWANSASGDIAQGDVISGFEHVSGGAGGDWLEGDNNDNVLDGCGGGDLLIGLGGNDLLFGREGNDTLIADWGTDILEGGSGSDLFAIWATTKHGIINDFVHGVDHIQLATNLFANFNVLKAAAVQHGADVVITNATLDITLKNVQLATLTASDFQFV